MSVSAQRRIFRAVDVLICTAILISGACHRAPFTAAQPTGYGRSFAGVDIVPTAHGGFVVRIHSAMVGAGEPLYVIDGTPMVIPPNRGIDWFKPEDIVAIKVLKYPHELAEYGTSGVNGVIIITTKQGKGPPR
jgi:TonB-dependent SusC/RagA subfamily outer membrane receptor